MKQDTLRNLLNELKLDDNHMPSKSYRKNAKIRFMNTIQEPLQEKSAGHIQNFWFTPVFRMTVICLIIAVNIIYASQFSTPSDVLFPVKVLGERIAMMLSPTATTRSAVAGEVIRRRAKEIEQVKKDGTKQEVQKSIQNFESTVKEVHQAGYISTETLEKELSKYDSLIPSGTTPTPILKIKVPNIN